MAVGDAKVQRAAFKLLQRVMAKTDRSWILDPGFLKKPV
jgi:hypothetical protein